MSDETLLVRNLIAEVGLAGHANAILRLAQPSIRVVSQRANDAEIALGTSKMGGAPDLPEDFAWEWFRWHGTPLTFLAQFRLSELAALDVEQRLPSAGMLYFFYETYEQRWGYDPEDRGAGRVLYVPDERGTFKRSEHPAGKFNGRWVLPRPACVVELRRAISLPDFELATDLLQLSDDEIDAYVDLKDTLYERDEAIATHRLLGYPDQIQGDMRYEIQMASNGLYWGDARNVNDPRVPDLEKGLDDWLLLLQIDTDDNLDVKWGDHGMIYYWIQDDALRAQQFDHTWLILQSF